MKICLVSSVLPIRGGVASFMDFASKKLDQLGYGLTVINVIGQRKESFTYFNKLMEKMISILLNSNVIFALSFIAARHVLRWRFKKRCDLSERNVVHAQDINSFNALYKFCKKHNIRLVLTVHGHLYNSGSATRTIGTKSWLSKYLLRQEIKAFQRAERIITVSDYSFNFVAQHTDARKVTIIRNFVDTSVFYPVDDMAKQEIRKGNQYKESDFILVYAGRLNESKGVSYILEGVKSVSESLPVKLIIAGDGPERAGLELFVKENQLEGIVHFVGEIDKTRLLEFYRLSDGFIMASITGAGNIEGTPMALLEAMACKLPVITTRAGGIAAVIEDGKNGLFTNERNPQSISDKIRFIYENAELRKSMGENALSDIKDKFSLDKVIQNILEIYEGGKK